jgi:hypothetical protein
MSSAVSIESGCAAANQRHSYRHRIRNLAYVTLGPDNGGILRDVSETGIAIQSVRPLNLNELVPVRFELLRPRTRVEAAGRVVWTDHIGQAGLQFSEISARSRRLLKEWLFTQVLQAGQASSESIFSQMETQLAPPQVPEELVSEAVQSLQNDRVMNIPWWPFAMTSGRFARLVDGLVVASAVLLFCVVSLALIHVFPTWPIALLLGIVLTGMFAGTYWILFTYSMGSTPGVIMAGYLCLDHGDIEDDDRDRFR